MNLTIISGLSGSGKSVALNTLEDAGYFCIDNLPLGMLEALGQHLAAGGSGPGAAPPRYAVGIDARNRPEDLAHCAEILDELERRGLGIQILFLTADRTTLIKRFSETRRRHPLSGADTPLAEAVSRERELLRPLQERADLTIDTTMTTVHQLRERVRSRLVQRPNVLSLQIESFGFKHGVPADADFVFDVRCLPNPHWEPELRPHTGRDAPVAQFLARQPEVADYLRDTAEFLKRWIPCFQRENRSYLTVAIGCTGGQHRSVYLAERLAAELRCVEGEISVHHRELS